MSDRTHDTQPDSPGQPHEADQSSRHHQPLQALSLAKDQALSNPDVMADVFSHFPPNLRAGTAARMTEVNRQWWHVGHRYLWREGFNQLSGLVLDVDDPARQEYLASLIKTIHFKKYDTILATDKTTLKTLKFPRLEAIHMSVSNLVGVKAKNLEALMVPSLRSFRLVEFWDDWQGSGEKDTEILLSALFRNDSLTTLSLDFMDSFPQSQSTERLLLDSLDSAQQLEDLKLLRLSTTFLEHWSPDVLLEKLLQNKPNLVSLCFPLGLDIREEAVDTFLSRVGPDWSLPSLKTITRGPKYMCQDSFRGFSNAPRFSAGPAASRLLDRMPNLEELAIVFWIREASANDLACVLSSLSNLRHLRKLDLVSQVLEADVYGEWLIQLATLSELEYIRFHNDTLREAFVTGAQMVHFLTSLPKLKTLILSLHFGFWPMYCSAEEKALIEAALERIDHVDLQGMTFEIRDTRETEE